MRLVQVVEMRLVQVAEIRLVLGLGMGLIRIIVANSTKTSFE